MSRFSNLEFDHDAQSAQQSETAPCNTEVKGEAHYASLARESFEHADFEAALRYFSKVLEFNIDEASAWIGQTRALIELGEFREAKLWANKALERFPDHPELLASKAVALARCGDTDAALAYSDASIEQRGDTPMIWIARGDVLLARKEPRAHSCFEKAQLLAPADWVVPWLTSRILYYYERFGQALTAATEAIKRNAGNEIVWLQLGYCQQKLSLYDQASQSFVQARSIAPKNRHAIQAMNGLARQTGASRLSALLRRIFTKR